MEQARRSDTIECPWCPSLLTMISWDSGRTSVHHHDEPVPDACRRGIKRTFTEVATEHGLTPLLREYW